MFTLLGITFAASAADSLNPIAIAQQLVFQSVSRKKKDITGFILGIGLTNFLAGVLVYYGLAAIMQRFLNDFLTTHFFVIPVGEILGGSMLLFYLLKSKLKPKQEINIKDKAKKTMKRLGFANLFGLGVISCGLELTSALPYFAFLTILLQYQLVFPVVILY